MSPVHFLAFISSSWLSFLLSIIALAPIAAAAAVDSPAATGIAALPPDDFISSSESGIIEEILSILVIDVIESVDSSIGSVIASVLSVSIYVGGVDSSDVYVTLLSPPVGIVAPVLGYQD